MRRLESFKEALIYLHNGAILSTGSCREIFKDRERIRLRNEGSSYSLSLDEFRTLFFQEIFYYREEDGVTIDEEKDIDYYRYYRK